MNSPIPPGVIAAARDAARLHLRIAGDSEDAVLERFAATAISLCEAYVGRALIVRDWEQRLGEGTGWQPLATAPVVAVTAVTAPEGSALPVDGYSVDIDGQGIGWVRVPRGGAARVVYTAGLASDWDGLPAPLAQGVTLLVAHLFEARAADAAPPAVVGALWRPWRRMRLRVPEHAA